MIKGVVSESQMQERFGREKARKVKRKLKNIGNQIKGFGKEMIGKKVGGMTAGSRSALGRIQKANMVEAKMMNKGGGADLKKDPTKPVNPFRKKAMADRALKAAKATRLGKIAAGVAGAALLGKAALEKMYEKKTGKKPFTKRRTLVDKKSKGGLKAELNNPAKGYTKGGMADYYKDLM